MLIQIRQKRKEKIQVPNQSLPNISQQQILPSQDIQDQNELGFNVFHGIQENINPNTQDYEAVIVENSKKKQIIINLNKKTFKKVKKYIETPEQERQNIQLIKNEPILVCRICLEQDIIFISPCKCDGSVKYVHQECLQTWLLKKFSIDDIKDSKAICELCHESLKCSFSFENKYLFSRFKLQPIAQNLFFILMFCSGWALLIVGLILFSEIGQSDEKYAYIFGACISVLTGVILLYILLVITIEIIKIRVVTKWSIMNRDVRAETDTECSILTKKQLGKSQSLPQFQQINKTSKKEKFGKTIFKFLKKASADDI